MIKYEEIYKKIIEKKLSKKDIKKWEINETIYGINQLLNIQNCELTEEFINKVKHNYNLLLNSFKNSFKYLDNYYVIYNEKIDYPFIDAKSCFIFTEEDWANKFVEFMASKYNIKVKTKKINNDKKAFFKECYRIGIKSFIINNGINALTIKENDIFDTSKFYNEKENKNVIINPNLQNNLILYYQELTNNTANDEYLSILENTICKNIVLGDFLLPMYSQNIKKLQQNKGTINLEDLNFGILKDVMSNEYIPIFTDYDEFLKAYNEENWGILEITCDDLLNIYKSNIENSCLGFIINCSGVNISFKEQNIKTLENIKKILENK